MNNTDQLPDIEELNSDEVARVIPTITYLVLLIITGAFGNLVVLYVYTTKYGPSNTKYYILCLSVIDLFTCCGLLPLEIAIMTMQYNFRYPWLCKASRFGNTISTLSSAAILMVIATDRYRRMCKPFGWQIASKYAKILCAGCIITAVLVSCPALFIYSQRYISIRPFNITGTDCSIGEDMKYSVMPLINNIVLAGMFVVGMVFISIMYCCIGFALHKHAKRMPKGFRSTTKRRLTRSSVSTVCHSNVNIDFNANSNREQDLVLTVPELATRESIRLGKEHSIDREVAKDSPKFNDIHEATASDETPLSNHVTNEHCKTSHHMTNGVSSSTTHCNSAYSMGSVTSHCVRGRTSNNFSANDSHQSSNVRKTNVLMLIISVTFIVSYLPHLLLVLIREINDTFEQNMSGTDRAAYKFFLRSYFLNCATNPVIYCIYGSHFRETCKKLFLSFCTRSEKTTDVFMS